MSLLNEIRTRITNAMRSGDELEKNLFRVVLGDVQTNAAGNEPTDEMAVAVIKKVIASLRETIKLGQGVGRDMTKEEKEQELLADLLPKNWDRQQIEAFFLDGDGPHFEVIRDAKNEGQAMGIAMKALKLAKAPVESEDVKAVVKKIRES